MDAVASLGMALLARSPTAPDSRPRRLSAGSMMRSTSGAPPPSVWFSASASCSALSAGGTAASASFSAALSGRTSS
jgi:hypothetical protein